MQNAKAISSPRKVSYKPGRAGPAAFLRLFIIPHILAALVLTGFAIKVTLVDLCGIETNATITKRWLSEGKGDDGKQGNYFHMEFRFLDSQNRTLEVQKSISEQMYRAVRDGQSIKIRYAQMLPTMTADLAVKGYGNNGFYLFWGFSIFWDSLLMFGVWFFYVIPRRQQTVLRSGDAVDGEVIAKDANDVDGSTFYYVSYRFMPIGQLLPIESRMKVDPSDFDIATIGQSITVFYLADAFRQNIGYECSDFIVSN